MDKNRTTTIVVTGPSPIETGLAVEDAIRFSKETHGRLWRCDTLRPARPVKVKTAKRQGS